MSRIKEEKKYEMVGNVPIRPPAAVLRRVGKAESRSGGPVIWCEVLAQAEDIDLVNAEGRAICCKSVDLGKAEGMSRTKNISDNILLCSCATAASSEGAISVIDGQVCVHDIGLGFFRSSMLVLNFVGLCKEKKGLYEIVIGIRNKWGSKFVTYWGFIISAKTKPKGILVTMIALRTLQNFGLTYFNLFVLFTMISSFVGMPTERET
ncbi:hypothetical protein F8388_021078 [Cannabis sativa]|uniref:Uncharacterized protein n=1 Tax=Cannabis sativa TaxID=3483 RepID=A0A7J6GZY7_CANSA|nr:hypothetical protein F8388_021078 [Cannabis sativa]